MRWKRLGATVLVIVALGLLVSQCAARHKDPAQPSPAYQASR